MRRIFLILFSAIFSGVLPAYAAWVPVDCKDRMQEVRQLHREFGRPDIETSWQNYMAAVRKSRQGSPLYAPHPFPKSEAEIVENFKYAYFQLLFEGVPWGKLPPRERPVFKAIQENRLRIEIVRVENWDFSRCDSGRPNPYFNLLRFFDRETGREVARSTQHFTGLMATYGHVSERTRRVPKLNEMEALIRASFGRTLRVEQPQYVDVGGLPYCVTQSPCVAFRSEGKIYLMDGGELLYEIEPTSPRESVAAFRQRQARGGLRALGDVEFEAPMVTLGFEWAKARLIGGQKPR